ncbi:MAG: hypothetical protein BWX84_00556 [Verrucomicrobia bacterium ADurb.Bin118]|nr:MAG: hypothetical protein BWX84_00556 [Verrucomicrobia bacterium ADurb.Bin118]
MNATFAASPSNIPARTPPTPADVDLSSRTPLLWLFGGAAFWLLLASVCALIASIKFHGPGFLADQAWLTYGRVRPAAWNVLLYGGAMPAGLGVALWMLCRLGATRLALPTLAVAGAQLWHGGVLVGFVALLRGANTGFEWLEMPRPAAVLLFLGYLLLCGAALATTRRRTERAFYPSQWFLLAALFWFPWIYSTANLLLLVWPVRGVTQSVIAWWYAANLRVVWLGLVGVGLIFYFVPKLLARPLHSRALAGVTFGGLVLFGSWSGIPGSAPVPAWIPTLSSVAVVLGLVPLLATILNCWRTLKGQGRAAWADVSLRFVLVGLVAFVIASLMYAALGAPYPGNLWQFTWLVPAQDHLAIYGFFVMVATGGVYHLLPRISGRPLCAFCVRVHFWVAVTGIVLTVLPLAVAGTLQGLKLADATVPFTATVNSTLMPLRISTLGELLVLFANFIFVRNVWGVLGSLGRARLADFWAAGTAPVKVEEVPG